MGQSASSSRDLSHICIHATNSHMVVISEDRQIISSLYTDLLARSSDPHSVDFRAFCDFFDAPPVWQKRAFSVVDSGQDGYLSYEDFMSFCYVSLFQNFLFKFVDLDADGSISVTDLTLFLSSLPNDLVLVLEPTTEEEKVHTSREYLLRIKLRKNAENKQTIINVRGNNYETVHHQLPFISETIISAFSKKEQDGLMTNKEEFALWIQSNTDLLEYLFNLVCPLGWLSQATIQKQCFHKLTTAASPLQRTFCLLYMKNDNTFAHFMSDNGEHRWETTSSRCCECLYSCFAKGSKVSPETYSFERGYKKKGSLLYVDDEKQKNCTLIYKFNALYIQLEISYFTTTFGIVFKLQYGIDVVLLKGCYIKEALPITVQYEKLFGFQLLACDAGQKQSKGISFYSSSKIEIQEWIDCLTPVLNQTALFKAQYKLQEQIGVGQFAKVHKAINTYTNSTVAVKIVNKQGLNELEKEMLRNEIGIVGTISHPSIVRFYSVVQSLTHVYFISELVPGGELSQYISMHKRLPEDQAAVVVYYLLEAVRYMHDNGVVHRDLKPENVMLELSENKERIQSVKIIDFGLSRVILPGELMLEQCGTLTYIAPEVLLKYGYGKEVDLWSIGIILYYILRGQLPYDAKDRMMIVNKILNSKIDLNEEYWRLISPEAKDLIEQLLEKNPVKRINPTDALNHAWIQAHVKNRTLDPSNLLYPIIDTDSITNYQECMTKALIRHSKTVIHSARQFRNEKFNTISSEYQ